MASLFSACLQDLFLFFIDSKKTIPHLIEMQCRVLKSNPQGPADSRDVQINHLFFNFIFTTFLPHLPKILSLCHFETFLLRVCVFFERVPRTRENKKK